MKTFDDIKKEIKECPATLSRGRKGESARLVLLGAVCGDMVGAPYEFKNTKNYDFKLFPQRSRFTDDTVCTIGIADALLCGRPFSESVKEWCRKYIEAGYGGLFRRWILSDSMEPYDSWGNGSAMRVSAVGAYARSLDEALELAKQSAEFTHNHPEGVKGAQATAAAIHYALTGHSKEEIKSMVESRFGYDLGRKYDDIQPDYRFEVSCQKSVPESIICFLESHDYESAIRKAVAMGGDADTMGAITGGIAAAFYGEIPDHILAPALKLLPDDMKEVINRFNASLKN